MAKSDYATMAFDQDGICDGNFTSLNGTSVEIYKNWLYLRSPEMWKSGGWFAEPTLAQIDSGNLHFHDLHIIAERCSLQNAVFVFVESHNHKTEKCVWMAGIGCVGYRRKYPNDDQDLENINWVGVTPILADKFFGWLKKQIEGVKYISNGPTKKWLHQCKIGSKYFNQGDAYFSSLGLDIGKGLHSPGETSEPIINNLIKGMK